MRQHGRWFGTGVVALGLAAALAFAPRPAVAAVAGTAHDLRNAAMDELCTPCHVPHQALTTLLIWNHVLSGNTFSWDESQTTAGTDYPANIDAWSGSTKLCLSCHDGSVEIGSIVNPAILFDPDFMPADHRVGDGGDMSLNHPVAVPYPANNAANTYNSITTGTGTILSEWVASPDPTDIKIFTDSSAAGPNNRGIECASCHNPHGTSFPAFLRQTNVGSQLCLECHIK